ncbi:MAG: cupredoxin domain-containing protein [Acidimicrobiales bacterium]
MAAPGVPHTATFGLAEATPATAPVGATAPVPGPSPQPLDAGSVVSTGALPPAETGPVSGLAGSGGRFTVIVPAAGDYPFVCLFHRASGMAGTLLVTWAVVPSAPVAVREQAPMRRLVLVFAVVSLLAAGCGGGSAAAPVKLAGTTNNHGTSTAKDDLAVKISDYYFSATFLRATAGQKFSVQLRNDGAARHTFTSEEMGVDLELAPGASRTVSLTAPSSGFTAFHCRFHQSLGMQGAVFVR